MMTHTAPMACEGCLGVLGPLDGGYRVCMPCTRARAYAATHHGRCGCRRQARPGEERSVGSRRWVPCLRCLGTIRQVS